MRKTKIIATLGPATDGEKAIALLIEAGVDVVRLNFSHGSHEGHARRAEAARKAAERAGRALAVMADLQGPKIRTGALAAGPVELAAGTAFTITTEEIEGGADRVSTNYRDLPGEVEPGQLILLDDGNIRLEVTEVRDRDVVTKVLAGGVLSERKAISLPGARISAPALTEKDLLDLDFAVRNLRVDFVALSFVRRAGDIGHLKKAIADLGGEASVVAKIEKPEAVRDIDAIFSALELGDGIMVARGDLGVECEIRKVPALQKEILAKADERGIVCITATQMLESMIERPMPSRAEASDIFNAILDGSDAVMLSGETAVGRYPVEAVRTMAGIIMEAEAWSANSPRAGRARAGFRDDTFELAICRAACHAAAEADAKAVVALTRSGRTALLLSKVAVPAAVPVLAVSPERSTCSKMALYYGVKPIRLEAPFDPRSNLWDTLDQALLRTGVLTGGDTIVFASGFSISKGATNICKIVRLGDHEYY